MTQITMKEAILNKVDGTPTWPLVFVIFVGLVIIIISAMTDYRLITPVVPEVRPTVKATFVCAENGWTATATDENNYTVSATTNSIEEAFALCLDRLD